MYKDNLDYYKTEQRYINQYVYKFIGREIDNHWNEIIEDEQLSKYINTGSGITYKCINISNNICLYATKNGNHRFCRCNYNASRWHGFQSEILDYFKINEHYELN